MESTTVRRRSMQKSMDSVLQDALDILEADDGKSFEEKKAELLRMLNEKQEALLAGRRVDKAIAGKSAAQIRNSFWKFGKEIEAPNSITLRKVSTDDRDGFLALQRFYSPTPAMLEQAAYQNMIWSEHTEQKSLMLSIDKNGIYTGYCGIQDLSKKIWEISIELLPENTKQGIGFAAITAMLNELRKRLGVSEYRIRIEPTNHASQRLFEKLGAVPNGISELWVHDQEDLEQLENDSIKNNPAKKKVPMTNGNLSAEEQRAINRHRQAQEQRRSVERNTALSQEKRDDLCTLSQPGFAFFAAKGYKTFHLRHCKKLSGISNVEGFPWYKDATRAGYRPCKCCKPDPKYDVTVSLPIYSTKRYGESVGQLKNLCNRFGFRYWEDSGLSYMETEVGIWRINPTSSPYRLDHINLTMTPDNRTEFHRQPRLFLSLRDAFYYIKRHDEGLAFTWKETAYVPKEAII